MTKSESPPPAPLVPRQRSRRTAELFDDASHAGSAARRANLLDEVVVINLPVARSLALRFSRRGVDVEDLVQVASEALVKASNRFDPARGKDFLSFAVPTIRGELRRHFRDSGWMVRPTRSVQENRWRIAKRGAALAQRLGHTPTGPELMAELDLTEEEYAEATSAQGCFRPTSLDQPASEDSHTSLGDLIGEEGDQFAPSEARLLLGPLVRRLDARDQRILYLRFFEGLGQSDIGRIVGVTQSQVSRILERLLEELHAALAPEKAKTTSAR